MAIYNTLSDQELTGLLRTGDRAAFREIYDRYWKLLFRAAFQASRDREDSLDICQSLFLWLWENRQAVHIATTLKGYLLTAVKYKIANLIRQGKFRETLFENLEELDARRYSETELEIQELKALINQLIHDLPERCREVFLLSRDEQLSHKEIADKLGLSEKTVDAHISNALGKLKAPLQKLASIVLLF
jgi:RNA polymerase sigma-70 factor (family 1)